MEMCGVYETSNNGSAACSPCPSGHKCFPGKSPQPCAPGQMLTLPYVTKVPFLLELGPLKKTFTNDWVNYTCVDCPAGSYCEPFAVSLEDRQPDDVVPALCPKGTFNSEVAKTSCTPCRIGYI